MRQIQDSPYGYLSENYNYMKLLKRTAFSLLGILLLILTIATILEKIYGTDFVNEYIYSSVPFVILWGVTAITSLLYIIKSKLHRQPVIFASSFSSLYIGRGIHHMDIWRTRHYACPPRRTTDLFHRFQRNFPPATFQHHTKPI